MSIFRSRDGCHFGQLDYLRRIFRLDDRQWQAFQAILDRPVADKPRLTRLLAEKSVLE